MPTAYLPPYVTNRNSNSRAIDAIKGFVAAPVPLKGKKVLDVRFESPGDPGVYRKIRGMGVAFENEATGLATHRHVVKKLEFTKSRDVWRVTSTSKVAGDRYPYRVQLGDVRDPVAIVRLLLRSLGRAGTAKYVTLRDDPTRMNTPHARIEAVYGNGAELYVHPRSTLGTGSNPHDAFSKYYLDRWKTAARAKSNARKTSKTLARALPRNIANLVSSRAHGVKL